MKKMLSLSLIFISLMMMLAVPMKASADMIIEPEDDFYKSHSDVCKLHERSYIVNGAKGYIAAYSSPQSSDIVCYIQNGKEVYISFTYKDSNGDLWGITPDITDQDVVTQNLMKNNLWIPMTELELIYDNISFMADHQSNFHNYANEMKDYAIKDQVYLWTYPGSGKISGHFITIDENFSISYTYCDENQYLWGYVPYYYIQNGWICMSAPESKELPITAPSGAIITPAKPVPESTIPPLLYLVIGCVLVLVFFTAGLIHLKMPKKK